ncbi:hypothetical protein NL676_032759 [Syzygium grande]|nr:hypothetical protein NL676_032759 [Syzygium grande]
MILLIAFYGLREYYKLPVTAGLLATNTLAYLWPGVLDPLLPSTDQSLGFDSEIGQMCGGELWGILLVA